MKKNNLIRFVQSLVLLPAMTISLGNLHNSIGISQTVLAQKVNIESGITLAQSESVGTTNTDEVLKAKTLQAEADAIDAYFTKYDMPLAGTGMKMAIAADNNDLDWRLVPAIAVRESTGGKHDCNKVDNNPFGWASCKIGFKSVDEAIETIAKNLGGNNPTTATHYDNKSTLQILHAYNPPSVVPRYAEQVMNIMSAIGDADVTVAPTPTTT